MIALRRLLVLQQQQIPTSDSRIEQSTRLLKRLFAHESKLLGLELKIQAQLVGQQLLVLVKPKVYRRSVVSDYTDGYDFGGYRHWHSAVVELWVEVAHRYPAEGTAEPIELHQYWLNGVAPFELHQLVVLVLFHFQHCERQIRRATGNSQQ